jgi:CheY-like chemotaxis protein
MEEILLVEDDDDIRETLADLLRSRGYAVTAVTNGRDAIEWLKRSAAPCLIILDLMLPIMDGWEFRAQQMTDPSLAAIPVIVLSGISDAKQHAVNLRAVDYLPKPIDLDRLYKTVEQHC